MNGNISAGIILFNPERERLLQNIKIISAQVEHIYVYHNEASESLITELRRNSRIVILGNGKNIGIASAMNQIMEAAEKDGQQWVITYDQDSVSETDLIAEYRKHLNHPNAAIICPQVIDERRKYMAVEKSDEIERVDTCITSGSCTRIDAWKEIGGFDDFLFIDLVDNDFCKRLTLNGWEILKLHNVILNQEFGDIELKGSTSVRRIVGISNFVRNRLHRPYLADNIGKLSYKKKVSPLRVYYTNRNVIYLNRKFAHHGEIGYDCYRCHSYFGFWLCFNLPSIIRGKSKGKIIKAIFSGVKDGQKAQVDPLP